MTEVFLSQHLNEHGLDVVLYENFITPEMVANLRTLIYEKISFPDYRRTSAIFGDDQVIYPRDYLSTSEDKGRPTRPWSELPGLEAIRDCVAIVAEQEFNVAIIQCYPHGRIGINPHKDREITEGVIAGLSLYPELNKKNKKRVERTLRFTRGERTVDLLLPNGSLYLMHPPTNRLWSHSIVKAPDIQEDRLSITFRYISPSNS